MNTSEIRQFIDEKIAFISNATFLLRFEFSKIISKYTRKRKISETNYYDSLSVKQLEGHDRGLGKIGALR